MRMTMPASFPEEAFLKFGAAAPSFLPRILSDEYMTDSGERMQHFNLSWQAVRYRYRTCTECDAEFKAMLAAQRDWELSDDERNYKLGRCVYEFFTNALSVFESFGFCLYFVGHALKPIDFPLVDSENFRAITLGNVGKAFDVAFPKEPVAKELSQLRANQAFQQIEVIRNILAHRTAGGRGSSSHSILHADGSFTEESAKEWFYLPGLKKTLPFDELFFEHILNNIGALVNRLAVASVTFIENQTSLATA